MKFAEPIKDIKKISQIKNILHDTWNIRDYTLFTCWINFWLRISDLLSLKIRDLFDCDWWINDYFEICEKKTWKWNKIWISVKLKKILEEYKNTYPDIAEDWENYVFFAKKSYPLWIKPIWRIQAWKLISTWAKDVWLKWTYSTHSLRKTLAYQGLQNHIPIELISERLNHQDYKSTKRYLALTKDETMDAFLKLDL